MTQPDLSHVTADLGQIEQVLMNLVVNAGDAMPDGGKLIIETANLTLDARNAHQLSELQPGDYVTMKLTDNGTGIDEEVGKGTGLGPSMCYGIVTQAAATLR